MVTVAFTRKFLKALGMEEEKIEQIIDAHSEVTNALKEQIKEAEENASKLESKSKEYDELKKKADEYDSTASELKKIKSEYEKYKSDIESKETATAKEAAVKAYFESKKITGANLDIALRGCKDEIASVELKDGKISDTSALDVLITGTYSGLISKEGVSGINVPNPPKNNPNSFSSMSLAEKMAYANSNPDSEEVKTWLKGE